MLANFERKLRYSRIGYSELESIFQVPKWIQLYQKTFGLAYGVGFSDASFQSLDWSMHEYLGNFDSNSEGIYLSRSYRGNVDNGNMFFGEDYELLKQGMKSSCIILIAKKDLILSSEYKKIIIDECAIKEQKSIKNLSSINLFDLPLRSHIILLDSF